MLNSSTLKVMLEQRNHSSDRWIVEINGVLDFTWQGMGMNLTDNVNYTYWKDEPLEMNHLVSNGGPLFPDLWPLLWCDAYIVQVLMSLHRSIRPMEKLFFVKKCWIHISLYLWTFNNSYTFLTQAPCKHTYMRVVSIFLSNTQQKSELAYRSTVFAKIMNCLFNVNYCIRQRLRYN